MEENKDARIQAPGGYGLDIQYYIDKNKIFSPEEQKYDIKKMKETFSTRFPQLLKKVQDPELAFEEFLTECTFRDDAISTDNNSRKL